MTRSARRLAGACLALASLAGASLVLACGSGESPVGCNGQECSGAEPTGDAGQDAAREDASHGDAASTVPRDAGSMDAAPSGDDGGPSDAAGPSPDAAPVDPGGSPACNQGGQTANSGGLEGPLGTAVVGLCRQAIGCSSTWTFAAPPDADRDGGTPNQKLLWRVWYYGWALRAGTAAQQSDARSFLQSFFDAGESTGHYAIGNADEVLTTSHYEIWSNGMTCARLLSVVNADATILAATANWWTEEVALYDLLGRSGSIDAPGARFAEGGAGSSDLRDTIFAMIQGRTPAGHASDPNAAWWDDYYNVAAWTLREDFRRGDGLGGAAHATQADLPHLHDPLQVYTRGDDYVFSFPQLRVALDPLFWVARIGGVTTYAPYPGAPGASPTPPPALQGATLLTVPGSP
ncbi:MAG TPA: hypothetical protein VGG39_28435 [Polyangiaceae bacterium]